jgi:hypothetical protein
LASLGRLCAEMEFEALRAIDAFESGRGAEAPAVSNEAAAHGRNSA